nr:hypothetical protein [Tanacetum cinerariifolium]
MVKEGVRGRGVKEKHQGSSNNTTQATGMMPSAADGRVVRSLGAHTVDENDGQTPSNSTANPNKGNGGNGDGGSEKGICVLIRLVMMLWRLLLYRHQILGNEIDVVVPVESIRAISE